MKQTQVKKTNTNLFGKTTRISTIVIHSLITAFALIVAAMMTRFLVNFRETWHTNETTGEFWVCGDNGKFAWFIAIVPTIIMWAFTIVAGIMYINVACIIAGKDKTKVEKAYKSLNKFNVAFLVLVILAFILLVTSCALAGQKIEGSPYSTIDEYWGSQLKTLGKTYDCREMIITSTVFAGINIGLLSAMINIISRANKAK